MIDPNDFIIARKRKKYKFAHFANLDNCFELEQWTKPKHPVCIEIGAGTAYFSVELAARHPERQYLALDVKADRLQSGARLAIERGVTNVQFVRAHADQLLEVCSPGGASEIWLTFSDPFPKKRSAKHRLTHPRFLSIYQMLLAGNPLHLKTDNHALFDWSLEQFVTDSWRIDELSYDLHESELPDDYIIITTFEQRFIDEGLPIYLVSASRFTN